MKLALVWFFLSASISIVLAINAPSFLPVGESTAEAIKISSELQLLDQLMSLRTVNSEILRSKHKELHKTYKQAAVNSQIENLPAVILFSTLIGLGIVNILVIFWLLLNKSSRQKIRSD